MSNIIKKLTIKTNMKKFRIVTNEWGEYDVQKRILFIFWETQTFMGFETIESAERWISNYDKKKKIKKELKKRAGKIIKYL